jgi:hypothetical protein
VSIVQTLSEGDFGFTIQVDGQPTRFVVVIYETLAGAQAAYDTVVDALEHASGVTVAGA